MRVQVLKTKKIPSEGLKLNIRALDRKGVVLSLVNNFTASAKGWSSPPMETLFGPLRAWLYPKILRSSRVKNATFTKTGIIINNLLIMALIISKVLLLYIFSVTLCISYIGGKIIKLRLYFVFFLIISLFIASLLFFLAAIRLGALKASLLLDFHLFRFNQFSLNVPVYLDCFSTAFLGSVSIIAGRVFIFSTSYISGEKYFTRFHLLVISFVVSIAALIVCPRVVALLLGWDGLGVTSYLLVIYFQNAKAYGAGLITALTNRIGDVLILFAIAIFSELGTRFLWQPAIPGLGGRIVVLMALAAITKRAQVPFSAWLPAAMAAPTPVSSLVHSSTLVTAGVYLVFRLRGNNALRFRLFVIGVATILMASLSALWEIDIKKIVALSTLSQLGLMFSAMGIGLFNVAFFHLLTHAYFKALLFITIGNSIHLSNDYQDLRKVGLCASSLRPTLRFALVANVSLCGIPFIAGFYSKDLILEIIRINSFPLIAWVVFYISVALTVAYTLRFTYVICWSSSLRENLRLARDNEAAMSRAIFGLYPLAIMGGRLLSLLLFTETFLILVPTEVKNLTLVIILMGGATALIAPNVSKSATAKAWSWGNMWSLPTFTAPLPIYCSYLSAAQVRGLDLSWVPLRTLALTPPSRLLPASASVLEIAPYALKRLSLVILIIIVIYTRVINLIIIFKVKS